MKGFAVLCFKRIILLFVCLLRALYIFFCLIFPKEESEDEIKVDISVYSINEATGHYEQVFNNGDVCIIYSDGEFYRYENGTTELFFSPSFYPKPTKIAITNQYLYYDEYDWGEINLCRIDLESGVQETVAKNIVMGDIFSYQDDLFVELSYCQDEFAEYDIEDDTEYDIMKYYMFNDSVLDRICINDEVEWEGTVREDYYKAEFDEYTVYSYCDTADNSDYEICAIENEDWHMSLTKRKNYYVALQNHQVTVIGISYKLNVDVDLEDYKYYDNDPMVYTSLYLEHIYETENYVYILLQYGRSAAGGVAWNPSKSYSVQDVLIKIDLNDGTVSDVYQADTKLERIIAYDEESNSVILYKDQSLQMYNLDTQTYSELLALSEAHGWCFEVENNTIYIFNGDSTDANGQEAIFIDSISY